MKNNLFALAVSLISFSFAEEFTAPLLESPPVFGHTSIQDPIFPVIDIKERPSKSVAATVLLSAVPGLGHAYLGDMQTAAGLAGSFSVEVGTAFNSTMRPTSMTFALNTWFYGIYAGYRDARQYNDQRGFRYAMPQDSLVDLVKAPFNPSIISKGEVWGGVLGMLVFNGLISYLTYPIQMKLSTADAFFPINAFPVGIGEEAIFRGYLQPQLSEYFTPWGGIATSSLIFGFAHVGNARGLPSHERRHYYSFILPCLSISGAYLGWLSYKNNSLKESVAVHAWYDFILFSVAVAANSYKAKAFSIKDLPPIALHFSF